MIERWYDLLDEIDGFIAENKDHLIKRNLDRLRAVSLMGLIIFILGMSMSYIILLNFRFNRSYLGILGVLIVYHVLAIRKYDSILNNKVFAKAFTLSFYVLALMGLLWIDMTLTPQSPPIWFCIGLVALSACYIDRFHVLLLLEVVMGVFGCAVINHYDNIKGVNIDCLSIMGAIMLFGSCYMMNLNLQADTGSDTRAIKQKSVTDLLTGLLNKIAFEDSCRNFLENRTTEMGCALIILDFDNFKSVNDNYGHQVGDEVLKHFGEILHESFRVNDIIGRVGGDEFMAMVTGSVPLNGITKRCENILHELAICHIGGSDGFSCSIGIAIDEREAGSDFAQLYAAADQALYRAKENGKAQFQLEHLTD